MNKIAIIGPSKTGAGTGGIAVHVQTLLNMAPFKEAKIIDPKGGLSSRLGRFGYLLRAYFVGHRLKKGSITVVFVNITLSLGGLTRVYLICRHFKCRPDIIVHVFCHGGGIQDCSIWLKAGLRHIFSKSVTNVQKFWFLTDKQKGDFEKLFPSLTTDRYRNYSAHTKPLSILPSAQEDTLKIIYVGRLVREKGVEDLIRAVMRLPAHVRSSVQLKVVGDGPMLTSLFNLVSSVKATAVDMMGRLEGEELQRIYQWADVLVLPTQHREGFPYVYIESMRAGVPMLTTPAGALAELIYENVNGWLLPEGMEDYTDNIVIWIMRLQNRIQEVRQMKSGCQEIFRRYLSRSVGEKFYTTIILSCETKRHYQDDKGCL